MHLEDNEYKELIALRKKGKACSEDERKRLAELEAKKAAKDGGDKTALLKYNDFTWWNKYPELMKTAVALPFNYLPGTRLFKKSTDSGYVDISGVTGTLTHYYMNTYGSSDQSTDGINQAFRVLWLAMHREYRGIGTYESADLGITQIATIEALTLMCEIERIYGVINYYGIINRNMPYNVLHALGVSNTLADNIRANFADFRYNLNLLLLRAQTMCVFKDMSIVAEKIALASNIFYDRESEDAQIIAYVNSEFGTYSATTTPSGGSVEWEQDKAITTSAFNGLSTYEQVLNLLRIRLDALLSDEDVQRQYSDMLKCFGAEKLLFVTTVPEDYVVTPVYSKEILHKEANMVCLGEMVEINGPEQTVTNYGYLKLGSIIPTALYSASGWDSSANKVGHRISQYNNVINTRVCYSDSNTAVTFTGGELNGYTARGLAGATAANTALTSYPVSDVNAKGMILNVFDNPDPTPEEVCEGVLWKAFTKEYISGNNIVIEVFSAFEVFGRMTYHIQLNLGGVPTIKDYNVPQFLWDAAGPGLSMLSAGGLVSWSKFDWQIQLYLTSVTRTAINTLVHATDASAIGEIDNVRLVDGSDIEPIHNAAVFSAFKIEVSSM